MSTITVETLLSDVKRLVIRLQRHDTAADSLIDQAIALKKKTESQASCPADPEDTEFSAAESNEEGGASQWESAAGDDGASAAQTEIRPTSHPNANVAIDPSVVSSIHQPENSNITKLQRENKELRLLLEEHQIALDMIMTKYRERMSELISATTTTTTPLLSNAGVIEELRGKTESFASGIELMYESTKTEETEEWEEIETIARLEAENKGLRELLSISTKLGEESAEEDVAGIADVTCISRQPSEEDGLYNSDHSQAGAPAGPDGAVD